MSFTDYDGFFDAHSLPGNALDIGHASGSGPLQFQLTTLAQPDGLQSLSLTVINSGTTSWTGFALELPTEFTPAWNFVDGTWGASVNDDWPGSTSFVTPSGYSVSVTNDLPLLAASPVDLSAIVGPSRVEFTFDPLAPGTMLNILGTIDGPYAEIVLPDGTIDRSLLSPSPGEVTTFNLNLYPIVAETSAVPEPSSFALLGIGGLTILGFRRRQHMTGTGMYANSRDGAE